MWGRLCAVVVALVAALLALHQYYPACHRGLARPHKYLATKAPYLDPVHLNHHPGHGKPPLFTRHHSLAVWLQEQLSPSSSGWSSAMGREIPVQKSFAKSEHSFLT